MRVSSEKQKDALHEFTGKYQKNGFEILQTLDHLPQSEIYIVEDGYCIPISGKKKESMRTIHEKYLSLTLKSFLFDVRLKYLKYL